tara:strand:- start:505 stop:738 length:234 start_codon:yes stop_codon:yes gene_type:complete
MNEGDLVASWLPTEDNDEVNPIKNVVLITFGESGYHKTSWKLDRASIIKRNKTAGFSEKDRQVAEAVAIRKGGRSGR